MLDETKIKLASRLYEETTITMDEAAQVLDLLASCELEDDVAEALGMFTRDQLVHAQASEGELMRERGYEDGVEATRERVVEDITARVKKIDVDQYDCCGCAGPFELRDDIVNVAIRGYVIGL